MPNIGHTEQYDQANARFEDVRKEARSIEKQALALKIIADNLLSKAEEESVIGKLKRKIKGE